MYLPVQLCGYALIGETIQGGGYWWDTDEVKQIDSCAGHFGMGGMMTMFKPSSLPFLKATMDTQLTPLHYACISFFTSML